MLRRVVIKTVEQWQADTRRLLAPEPHAEGAKATCCLDCGVTFWQWAGKYKQVCPDCSAARQRESIISMREKRGYMYERWVIKRYMAARAEMQRLGLPTDPDA